jgi:hypothetical protein
MLKIARRAVVFLGALLLVAIAGLFALRAYGHHRTVQAVAIHSPNAIDEGLYVKIGGIDQWLQVRGLDRNNPVMPHGRGRH